MPGRGVPRWAATNRTVSANCRVTAPLACRARSPEVSDIFRPPISRSTVTGENSIVFGFDGIGDVFDYLISWNPGPAGED